MTRAEFIAAHVAVCKTRPARKYDAKKPNAGFHTLDYSRRKCAKALWRRKNRARGRHEKALQTER